MGNTFAIGQMAKSKPSFLCLLILIPALLSAQITFQRTYGGDSSDAAWAVQQTADRGYVLAGRTGSFGAGGLDAWLVRTDSLGDTLWTRAFGGAAHDIANSVQQTSDHGYILTGWTTSFGAGDYDAWLIRTDSSSDTLWTRTYGGAAYDGGFSVQVAADHGYILAGRTSSFGAGEDDVWLIRTDSLGDVLWSRTFGGIYDDFAFWVQQTPDRGYILACNTESFGPGDQDVWLIKTDSLGDTLWTRTFGGSEWEEVYSVQQTADKGYILTGGTSSFGAGSIDAWIIKTDSVGDTLWTKTLGGAVDDYANSAQQTPDRGYMIAGYTLSFGAGDEDAWLIRMDSLGDTLWARTLGGGGDEWLNSVRQTADRGYILVGTTWSYGVGGDAWLIKTDSLGNIGVAEERPMPNPGRMAFTCEPNPCRGTAAIHVLGTRSELEDNSVLSLRVYDATGRLILQSATRSLQSQTALDLRAFPAGVYTVRLDSATQRLVVQR